LKIAADVCRQVFLLQSELRQSAIAPKGRHPCGKQEQRLASITAMTRATSSQEKISGNADSADIAFLCDVTQVTARGRSSTEPASHFV
jgi:hypothetical protein